MKEVHFWEFRPNYCIRVDNSYKQKIFKYLLSTSPLYKIAKLIKMDESVLREFKNNDKSIEIKSLAKVFAFLSRHSREFELHDLERHITWIGPHVGKGISYPRLPFKLDDPEFVRLLSAIFGDGTITNWSGDKLKYKLGSMEYWNNDPTLRKWALFSAIKVFGGLKDEYTERLNRNSVCLKFSSVIRDALLMNFNIQGEKSVLNPHVPSIVMGSQNSEMWMTWLQQSFDDEGSVRFRENYNHEIYLTRVMDITKFVGDFGISDVKISFVKLPANIKNIVKRCPVNMLVDEKRLLDRLGISSVIKPQEIYKTKKGALKVKWRLYVTRKENIKQFLRYVGFKSVRKLSLLNKIVGDTTEFGTQNKRNGLEPEIRTIGQREMGKRENIQI